MKICDSLAIVPTIPNKPSFLAAPLGSCFPPPDNPLLNRLPRHPPPPVKQNKRLSFTSRGGGAHYYSASSPSCNISQSQYGGSVTCVSLLLYSSTTSPGHPALPCLAENGSTVRDRTPRTLPEIHKSLIGNPPPTAAQFGP
ncbi:hypothetical protein E2C01_027206 [Portunus trituberculatus]|uniref:Uncharacterized protein n=1 Tax=Portunus trituberculatus TaxID=210409 RepID=A0A5B7EHB1_PORTR|nr:hypothetical protein [Portunus trituberculatus]